ncbi:MAG TPA: hypothetical protein VFF16_05625, partial [Telluria sp.]|nr:hypothetical protein [Telluria sp.]
SWRLYLGDDDERAPCARIRRRVLSWAPTWDIQGDGAPFQIKKKLWSWTRQYYVVGGPYDGATVKGKLWDLSFSVAHHGDVLATSAGKLLSLRDRHRVDMRREEDELFIVIAMLVLQIDRRTEASQSGD